MELVLWRHADAEAGFVDDERRLTNTGVAQAEGMAAWLKSRLPAEVDMLVSPAARAQQTARAFRAQFKTTPAVGTAAFPQGVLEAAGWPAGKGTVLVVGHQPTLGQVAAMLMSGKAAEWSVKKGAIWWFAAGNRDDAVLLRAVLAPDQLEHA